MTGMGLRKFEVLHKVNPYIITSVPTTFISDYLIINQRYHHIAGIIDDIYVNLIGEKFNLTK